MKQMKVAVALTTALLIGVSPCHATESVVAAGVESGAVAGAETAVQLASDTAVLAPDAPSLAESSSTSTQNSGRDFWRDATASPGEDLQIKFQGSHNFDELKVEAASPFQNFRVLVETDQTIVVFVPQNFAGASTVSPVFTVSDQLGEIDTFSVTVDYPRPMVKTNERTNPLFSFVSALAFRIPQLPFLAQLFED